MAHYSAVPGLAHYLLEESYVLGFDVGDGRVAIDLDVVLIQGHPRYEPPRPDEQFCYRRARVAFRAPSRVMFRASGAPPTRDATGEIDYGEIDTFTVDDGQYRLEGTWGTLDLSASGVDVSLQDSAP